MYPNICSAVAHKVLKYLEDLNPKPKPLKDKIKNIKAKMNKVRLENKVYFIIQKQTFVEGARHRGIRGNRNA